MLSTKLIDRYNFRISKMVKVLVYLVSSASFLMMTCQARAMDSGFYAGVGITGNSAEDGGASSNAAGITITGGYSFSKYLGSEISLLDIGDHSDLGMQGTGLSLGILGHYPFLDKFSLFAELGYMSLDIKIDEMQNAAQTGTDAGTLQDGRDSSVYYSYGVRYQLKNWAFSLKNSVVDLDADMNIVAVQARYHF